jgi:quinol monooxygenase YgiN
MKTLLFLVSFAACGPTASTLPPDAECTRGTRESDLSEGAWTGPGALADGGLAGGSDVVISTTFLALDPGADAQALFGSLFADIRTDLQTRDGLIAWKVYTSTRCVSARTLGVWRDEASMFAFATGRAHAAAAAKIGTLSRGNSAVAHWHDQAVNADLPHALVKLEAADAPF